MNETYNSQPNPHANALSSLEISKVLRNTYALLAMTLMFSALTAGLAIAMNLPYGAGMICSLLAIAIVWFVLPRTAQSAAGIFVVFAFTGLLGAGLGPVLNYFLATESGSAIVMQALGGTAFIFLGLSGYTLVTRKDFSFMTGFIMTGLMVAFVAGIANIFLQISGLSLIVSSMFLLLSSAAIMWETSRIIHGGQTNYVLAAASLYVSIYNIFVSLLNLLSILSDD